MWGVVRRKCENVKTKPCGWLLLAATQLGEFANLP